MPSCFIETVSREITTMIMPSPNLGAVTLRASLVLMSEATDTVPQGTHDVRTLKLELKHHSVLNSLFAAKLRDYP